MKKSRRRIIAFTGSGGIIALWLFNAFEHALEAPSVEAVPLWLAVPFVLFLAAIAFAPFVNRHWWEHHYPTVAIVMGAVVVSYYVFVLGNFSRLLLTLYDYVSFISLIGSLFVVAGGIHFNLRGKAAPWENVALLGFGAVISNILGTTGASMLLIRPYLRSNKLRLRGYHVVFFIFIVSNIGGALTPIGDPPLFLGYLKGVPFFWVMGKAWESWLLVLTVVLTTFYVIDRIQFNRTTRKVQAEVVEPEIVRFGGLKNGWFLVIIIAAVFIERPLMLREIIMWSAALASYFTTQDEVHTRNDFNFVPLREVAILFLGIFATMIPALDWLELNAGVIGIATTGQFFWWTGTLSSLLDNAPTYLSFLSTAFGLHGATVDNVLHMHAILGSASPAVLGIPNPLQSGAALITSESWKYVQAISLGAVFFGAMTYIGNGPNFMVKSIAEQAKADCPSFFGYVFKYSIPVLIPVYVLVWWLNFS